LSWASLSTELLANFWEIEDRVSPACTVYVVSALATVEPAAIPKAAMPRVAAVVNMLFFNIG